jgi:hypothetical protein
MIPNKKRAPPPCARPGPARALREHRSKRCSLQTHKEHRASQTFPESILAV